jgi:predicted Zn-dependent protease with MMP-like domain
VPGGRRYAPAVVDMSPDRFEDLVGEALDSIPEPLGRLMENVAVVVREGSEGSRLLGRYDGIPLTERDAAYTGVAPDRITIFRRPLLAMCATEDEVVEQVRITVVHEVAHHFGIDDDRLHELGWA